MPVEIERKFLVDGDAWRNGVLRHELFRQGYLAGSESCSVRVRVGGERAWVGIKGRILGASRPEYEYEIPVHEANEMLDTMCVHRCVEKRRYWVPHAGHEWEVDEFLGSNAGLVVAELELDDEAEAFAKPSWLGQEVTQDARYYSANLAQHPWCEWPQSTRGAR